MIKVFMNFRASEFCHRGGEFAGAGKGVKHVGGMTEGVGPKVNIDGLGIIMLGVQELRASGFSQVPNATFGYAGLVMGTDATKGNGLLGLVKVSEELGRVEDAVVSVIVANGDAMLLSEAFKSFLGLESLFSLGTGMDMDIT